MPMLADLIDAVIGVDTHTGTHTAAVADRLGAHLATIETSADAQGYARLIKLAVSKSPGPKIAWAVEGSDPTARAWPALWPPPGTW